MDDEWFGSVSKVKVRCSFTCTRGCGFSSDTKDRVFSTFALSHQTPKVAQGVSSQLYDALREAAVVADEAGEDGGQTVASSVQHHRGGDSFYRHLGAAAICGMANEEHQSVLFTSNQIFSWSFYSLDWDWAGWLVDGENPLSWGPEPLNAREA